MKIVFITNFVHHHQIPIADEFYKLLGVNYTYISTDPLPEWLIKGGYDPTISRPYIIRSYENDQANLKARKLAYEADVVITGSNIESFIKKRIKNRKLTFRYSERWFKKRPWYLSGPKAWINYFSHHIIYKNKPLYMLAASAYTANDAYKIGAYKNKVYKWGYFTRVDDCSIEARSKLNASREGYIPRIMWCARFIRWKHPELPILLASRLKQQGYKFTLDMYGSGEELESTKKLASQVGVHDVVSFCGNHPNEIILQCMREHDIFLFTSDRNEGWGAVLNESMSNGCAVVASNMIGAVPFLINDGENGLIFKSEDLDSLTNQVQRLLNDVNLLRKLSQNAIMTMRDIWSPNTAARRFIILSHLLLEGKDSIYADGPCSKAYPYIIRK